MGLRALSCGGKLFAAVCQPGPEHKDYANRPLVNLKCDRMRAELLRSEFAEIVPGFYMDKRNWIAVFLNGNVPEDVLRELRESAWQLVFSKLTKKR